MLHLFGIGDTLRRLWDIKVRLRRRLVTSPAPLSASALPQVSFEGLPLPYADTLVDYSLHLVNNAFPAPLPAAVQRQCEEYDHHLVVSYGEFGGGERQRFEAIPNSP